jgi:hypothetical protein
VLSLAPVAAAISGAVRCSTSARTKTSRLSSSRPARKRSTKSAAWASARTSSGARGILGRRGAASRRLAAAGPAAHVGGDPPGDPVQPAAQRAGRVVAVPAAVGDQEHVLEEVVDQEVGRAEVTEDPPDERVVLAVGGGELRVGRGLRREGERGVHTRAMAAARWIRHGNLTSRPRPARPAATPPGRPGRRGRSTWKVGRASGSTRSSWTTSASRRVNGQASEVPARTPSHGRQSVNLRARASPSPTTRARRRPRARGTSGIRPRRAAGRRSRAAGPRARRRGR